MKRIITLFLLGFLCHQAQSQVLWSTDFESGTLAPMTAVDVDGRTVAPQVATFAGPTWTIVQQTETNKMVLSTSWFAPPGAADDWLILPALTITDTNTFLFWEAYSPDVNFRDGYQVRISTTDDQVASFTSTLTTVTAEETTLKKRAANLDAYIGQTIHIAFRNNSNDKYLLFMDNISVLQLPANEVFVKGVSFEKYNPVGSQVPVTITIENNGASPITSLEFTWSDGVYTYTDTLTDLSIGTRDIQDITHNVTFDITEAGEFPLNIFVENPNGTEDNPFDNLGARTVYGLSEAPPKKVVVEEGTGTWCGWCPRGFVAMEDLGANYADVAIPIAIHNFDPMLLPDYDTPFSSTIGGYPSGHVDRKLIDIDPDNPVTGYGFDDAVEDLETRMVPSYVDVTTTYDPDTRTVQITGTARLSIATQDNALRFGAVITEDGVKGASTTEPLTDYDQVNYYAGGANGAMGGFEELPDPVPASQMIYNDVARALIGGFYGMENSIPDAVAANEEFTFEFNYVVPAGYNPDNMDAIVFVLDEETGEILNADIEEVKTTTSVPLVPFGKSLVFPNPATDVLNLSVDFQTTDAVSMNIYDTYGRLIQNLGNIDLTSGLRTEKIDISSLNAGAYILELRHKNSVTALPFTKM
jgi:hypothetical protein